MRLIDADKLNPDRMTNKGTVAISQSQISKAPTVQAVPIEVLDKMRAEIEEVINENEAIDSNNSRAQNIGLMWVLQIIDKHKGEDEWMITVKTIFLLINVICNAIVCGFNIALCMMMSREEKEQNAIQTNERMWANESNKM